MPSTFRDQWRRGLRPALGIGAATCIIFLLAIINYQEPLLSVAAMVVASFFVPAVIVLLLYVITGVFRRTSADPGA